MNKLEAFQAFLEVAEALKNPDAIRQAGEELRQQFSLSQEQINKYNAANEAIRQGNTIKESLDAEYEKLKQISVANQNASAELKAASAAIQQARSELNARESKASKDLEAIIAREDAVSAIEKRQAEKAVDQRQKDQEQDARELALRAQEEKIASALKSIGL